MDYELKTSTSDEDLPASAEATEPSQFRISTQPVIARTTEDESLPSGDLPRSYGTQTLTLMARDPRTLFAHWDIDWAAAFRDEPPRHRQVCLRLLDTDGAELASVEVEPLAGNTYISVANSDATYQGEIGYFDPPKTWNALATSEIVTTPADTIAAADETDFATVPFHLSFQHMIDQLRISKQENESLTSMLADLRQRAAHAEKQNALSESEQEIVRAMEAATPPPQQSRLPAQSDFWTRERIERILGLGGSSPANGFGGSSWTR